MKRYGSGRSERGVSHLSGCISGDMGPEGVPHVLERGEGEGPVRAHEGSPPPVFFRVVEFFSPSGLQTKPCWRLSKTRGIGTPLILQQVGEGGILTF